MVVIRKSPVKLFCWYQWKFGIGINGSGAIISHFHDSHQILLNPVGRAEPGSIEISSF